jgi:hypothetical protein
VFLQLGSPDVNGTGIWQFSAIKMLEGLRASKAKNLTNNLLDILE